MKVLVLDEWIPYPLISGKRLRSYHLITRAARTHDITYLCFHDTEGEEGARQHLESLGIKVATVERKNPFSPAYRLYAHAAANLFSPNPLVMRKHLRRDYLRKMHDLLRTDKFDLVHCEWTHYGAYVQGFRDIPTFLSSHNIEAMPWERLYAHERSSLRRLALYLEWKKMRAFEARTCRLFDHVSAVSDDDKTKFMEDYGCKSVTVIPNGTDAEFYRSVKRCTTEKTLVFSASYDAFVNQDAALYWMRSVFPTILQKEPEAKTLFLGKDPPGGLTALAGKKYPDGRIQFTGTVPDVRPHLARCNICVVPIRVAGGSRIKILEAMAAGLPVVSTTEGAEGLEVVHGEHVLIARGEEQFAGCVLELLRNDGLARSLTERARRLVEEKYDWGRIAPLLEKAWQETVERA